MIIIQYLTISPLGDSAIVIKLGNEIELETHKKVQELSRYLDSNHVPAVIEYVPAFASVTLYYDCVEAMSIAKDFRLPSPYEAMEKLVRTILNEVKTTANNQSSIVEIPVCYGGEYGPDLEYVAEHNNLTISEVIELHSRGTYCTYMIGFAPGFPYLGGLSNKLATPRRKSPRLQIPAGSVGIAGTQTGVYPISTPGGWQLIGKTPLRLFHPEHSPPTLLKAGDTVRFKPISPEDYECMLEVKT